MFSLDTTNQFSYKATLPNDSVAAGWEELGLDGENQNDVAALGLVRAFCGWHVAPAMTCEFSLSYSDFGAGDTIVLPFQMVSVDSGATVYLQGEADVVGVRLGNHGVIDVVGTPKAGNVYTLMVDGEKPVAGLAGSEAKALGAVVKQVSQALAQPANVVSEKAGAVQITYDNGKRSGILGDRIKAVLAPYKLELRA